MNIHDSNSVKKKLRGRKNYGLPAQPPVWVGFILGFIVMIMEISYGGNDMSLGALWFWLGLALVVAIFFLYCVYKIHKLMKTITKSEYPISPAASVGYHFIPIYNIYWVFKWPSTFSNYINKSNITRMIPGWILGLMLFLAGMVIDYITPTVAVFMQFGVLAYINFKLKEYVEGVSGKINVGLKEKVSLKPETETRLAPSFSPAHSPEWPEYHEEENMNGLKGGDSVEAKEFSGCGSRQYSSRFTRENNLNLNKKKPEENQPQSDEGKLSERSSLSSISKNTRFGRIRAVLTSKKIRISAAAVIVLFLIAWLVFFKPGTDREIVPKEKIIDSSGIIDHLTEGQNAFRDGDYKLALSHFRKAPEDEKTAYQAYLSLGDVYLEQSQMDKAVEEYEKAITLNKKDPRAYQRLGSIFENDGKWEIAEYYYQRFIYANPEHPKCVEFERKIRQWAVKSQNKQPVVTQNRTSAALLFRQGVQAFDKENYSVCIARMEDVLEINPKHAQAKEYLRQSRKKLAFSQVEELLNGYSTAFQDRTLPEFYQRNCIPESLPRIKTEAWLIIRSYYELHCFISNVDMRLTGEDRMEVEFSHIITGKSIGSDIKTVLFEGIARWILVKKSNVWKIAHVTSRSSGRK